MVYMANHATCASGTLDWDYATGSESLASCQNTCLNNIHCTYMAWKQGVCLRYGSGKCVQQVEPGFVLYQRYYGSFFIVYFILRQSCQKKFTSNTFTPQESLL